MFYIGLYRENYEKISLSETTIPRALIFGLKQHHLVNFYQVCSNYIPGAKNPPPPSPGHMFYIDLYRGKHEKIFLSETMWPRAL